MVQRGSGPVVELDFHNMLVKDAQRELTSYLSHAPDSVREVRVVHGYHGGTALRDMIRYHFHHPRIKTKMIALNPGETRLILK